MQNVLTDNDRRRIAGHYENNLVMKVVKLHKELQVDIDDVLIMEVKDRETGEWTANLVSKSMPLPKKYKVVHIDEYGVAWVKLIKVAGGLGKSLKCVLNIDLYSERWKQDKRQLESILIGHEYDPREEYKDYTGGRYETYQASDIHEDS